MPKSLDVDDDRHKLAREYAQRYRDGESVSAIAIECGYSWDLVRTLVLEGGVSLPLRRFRVPKVAGEERRALARKWAQMYRDGATMVEIAEQSGYTTNFVITLLREEKVPTRRSGASWGRLVAEDESARIPLAPIPKGVNVVGVQREELRSVLAAKYRGGASLHSLAQESGRSASSISELLSEAGVTMRSRGRPRGRPGHRGTSV